MFEYETCSVQQYRYGESNQMFLFGPKELKTQKRRKRMSEKKKQYLARPSKFEISLVTIQ